MSIINGTFNTDLSGWTITGSTGYASWEAGRAKLSVNRCDGAGMYQEFTIDSDQLIFTWAIGNVSAPVGQSDPERVRYEFYIGGVLKNTEDMAVFTGGSQSQTTAINTSTYIGQTGKLVFYPVIRPPNNCPYGAYAVTLWVDNIKLAPLEGCISFSTDVPGASIYIDGILQVGYITPAIICGISLGQHTYELRLTGYQTITGNVTLGTGQGETVSHTLVPLGSISFASIPSGARIFLAPTGQTPVDQGANTPTTIIDLPIGSYDYIFRLDNYNDLSGTVSVTQGTTTPVSVNLVPSEGCISFSTNVPGASIYIDGILQVGYITPAIICGISLGQHTYELRLTGYQTITGNVTLGTGQGEIVSQIFVPSGCISFSTNVPGASIYIDGILQIGYTTPAIICELIIGSHTYELRLTGYQNVTGNVNVTQGTTTPVSVNLVPSEGCISFSTDIPGASIYIDGILQTATTPAIICGLSLGPHTYELRLTGYQTITGNVTLVTGQGETISKTFTQLGSLYISSTPSGATIYIDSNIQPDKTPTTITDLIPGTHSYKLTLIGYQDSEGFFEILSGQTTTLPVTLNIRPVQAGFGGVGALMMGSLLIGAIIMSQKEKEKKKMTSGIS